jgi:hypothetical protein
MTPDAPSAPPPHLIPVDHATRPPCPRCGARQWLQRVTYDQCAPCGDQDSPTPGEILAQQEQTGSPRAYPTARVCRTGDAVTDAFQHLPLPKADLYYVIHSVTLPVLKGLERRRAAEAALERLREYELTLSVHFSEKSILR